jgi:two-component system CheB/CheR fusion protein
VRPEEATGRPLADLDIGLPVQNIVPLLRKALTGKPAQTEARVEGMNRRGRPVSMVVQCSLLRADDGSPQGVIAVMNKAGQVHETSQVH